VETIKNKKINTIFSSHKNDYYLEKKQVSEVRDLKIKNFALKKMVSKYDHLISSSTNVILKLFYDLLGRPINFGFYQDKYEKIKLISSEEKNKIPIGIKGPNWLNALIQFIIHLPSILNVFDFIPKSFLPFNLFFDSYEYSRNYKAQILNSEILLECLYKKFPQIFFLKNKDKIDLYKILNLIISTSFDESLFNFEINQKNINFLPFHPNWQIIIDSEKEKKFEDYIARKVSLLDMPKEFLVSYEWFDNGKKKKFSSKLRPKKYVFLSDYFYQLDAFIEYREDEGFSGSYITYLKIDNDWYQCEDAKIKKIKSANLFVALYRSILLHYRIFNKNFNEIV
jgi:hypothetical protein